MRVGIVGYSGKPFNKTKARGMLADAFLNILCDRLQSVDEIVSGLTNIGIPAIAYDMAKKYGWKTVGIACEKAEEFECFPVDKKIIVGTNWGDESETFLDNVDIIIRVGGGVQSIAEVKRAKEKYIPTIEYELEIGE